MPILSELERLLRIVISPFCESYAVVQRHSAGRVLFHPKKNSVRVRAHIYNQEDSMNKSHFHNCSSKCFAAIYVIALAFGIVGARWLASAQAVPEKTPVK